MRKLITYPNVKITVKFLNLLSAWIIHKNVTIFNKKNHYK